jgi:hypothetical protein
MQTVWLYNTDIIIGELPPGYYWPKEDPHEKNGTQFIKASRVSSPFNKNVNAMCSITRVKANAGSTPVNRRLYTDGSFDWDLTKCRKSRLSL